MSEEKFLEYVEERMMYKTRYELLLKYLMFQIETESYISSEKLKQFIDYLEPQKEEGESNE